MRVLVETERTLVVETPGNTMKLVFVCVALPLIVLHGCIFYPQVVSMLQYHKYFAGYSLIGITVIVYILLAILIMGSLRDKITTTFHGGKALLIIEHVLPFGFTSRKEIRFSDIEQFEISRPQDKGFCQIRMKDGSVKTLFRIRGNDDFGVISRLDMITRHKIATIS